MGAVSSIGTGVQAVEAALRQGRSGVRFIEEWKELGGFSHVGGLPDDQEPGSPLATRQLISAGGIALMALKATSEALGMAGFGAGDLRGTDLAVLIGTGTGSTMTTHMAASRALKYRTSKRVSAFTISRVMGSTASAHVSVALGSRGENLAVSSACATGAHSIGIATEMIRAGKYDRALAGASDEVDWTRALAFDAMQALSRRFNDEPERASRPFDRYRDGFVCGGGAGVVLLEELQTALSRGATPLAEIVGYAAGSDGNSMFAPLSDGATRVMAGALRDAGLDASEVDYVNAHGTSTPLGDVSEANAMKQVFGSRQPRISSTKSLTGHPIGPAGSLEVIYSVLMMRGGFLAPNINVDEVDPECAHLDLVVEPCNGLESRTVMSNSFGFGGSNACLILRRWE
jgi:3-oxoacyl-[acyl-carrier-protein] synthase-1